MKASANGFPIMRFGKHRRQEGTCALSNLPYSNNCILAPQHNDNATNASHTTATVSVMSGPITLDFLGWYDNIMLQTTWLLVLSPLIIKQSQKTYC